MVACRRQIVAEKIHLLGKRIDQLQVKHGANRRPIRLADKIVIGVNPVLHPSTSHISRNKSRRSLLDPGGDQRHPLVEITLLAGVGEGHT